MLETVEVSKPRIPVISNVDAKPHSDPAVIKKILTQQVGGQSSRPPASPRARRWHLSARSLQLIGSVFAQVTSPVQWETIMTDMTSNGFEEGYELGPGKVLAGIMKRVDKKAKITNIEV